MKSLNRSERSTCEARIGVGGRVEEYPTHTRTIFMESLYSTQAVITLPLFKSTPRDRASPEAKDTTLPTSIPTWLPLMSPREGSRLVSNSTAKNESCCDGRPM